MTATRAVNETRRVLVVDDDSSIRSFVGQALGDEGYEVRQAANGAEALDALARNRPDLILLDVRMPGVDGWQVLDELRSAAGPQTPVVVMTASYTGQDRALQSGAQGYLAKPFELNDLLECVDLHSRLRLDADRSETRATADS
jgi:two-component system response regulator MprA